MFGTEIHQENVAPFFPSFATPKAQREDISSSEGAQQYNVDFRFGRYAVPEREPVTLIGGRSLSQRIANSINASRSILELQTDWDGQGSVGYAEATWSRATSFVIDVALAYRRTAKVWVSPPTITPGPEASIDIHWQWHRRELLLNVPPSTEAAVTYYGHGGADDTIKGRLDTSLQNEWIFAWLLR
jgi:hypothetical protein